MTRKDNHSVDSFIDQREGVWVKNTFPKKSWTRYENERAYWDNANDSKRRSYHTEAEALQAMREAEAAQQSRELLYTVQHQIL